MDSSNTNQGHQDRLQQISQQLAALTGELSPSNLREIRSLADEMQSIACCHYINNHHLGTLEVTSEEFHQDVGRYMDITNTRSVRVVSPSGGTMSMCSSNPLIDPFVWCPVCKSTPSMDAI